MLVKLPDSGISDFPQTIPSRYSVASSHASASSLRNHISNPSYSSSGYGVSPIHPVPSFHAITYPLALRIFEQHDPLEAPSPQYIVFKLSGLFRTIKSWRRHAISIARCYHGAIPSSSSQSLSFEPSHLFRAALSSSRPIFELS